MAISKDFLEMSGDIYTVDVNSMIKTNKQFEVVTGSFEGAADRVKEYGVKVEFYHGKLYWVIGLNKWSLSQNSLFDVILKHLTCSGSRGCIDCSNCKNCVNCYDCTDCSLCMDCMGCRYIESEENKIFYIGEE